MPRSDIPVITPYNPLDKRNLAESVASAMLHTPVQKLPPQMPAKWNTLSATKPLPH